MTPNNTSWQEEFDREFSHVGWIPENKEHIISFIQSLLDKKTREIIEEIPGRFRVSNNRIESDLTILKIYLKSKYLGEEKE